MTGDIPDPDEEDAGGAVAAVVADIDLAEPSQDDVAAALEDTATDSGELAYAQVGSEADVFDSVNASAAAWAKDQAAALVTGVSDTTRAQLRGAISAGLKAGMTNDQIADSLQQLGAFSADRARLIAYTEISGANSQGALNGYKLAASEGVAVQKAWILGEHPCDDCEDNAAAGAIDLDDTFPSGDDAPPAHPNCECSLTPVVADE